jgi:hypothetical protein
VIAILPGCGGEPSHREVENARAFEALLTAVSLKHIKEVENDAKVIQSRYEAGDLSDANYRELGQIIEKARAHDWAGAERQAYDFRKQFGDEGSYFK